MSGRSDGNGKVQSSAHTGRGQARVFTLSHYYAQTSNAVVVSILQVCCLEACVLMDPGATHSFIAPIFASKFNRSP